MEFSETSLSGVTLIRTVPASDERGYFARSFCAREFDAFHLNSRIAQASYSFNKKSGTLRGLHFQSGSAAEDKLVSCIRGAIFDVMVDIRRGSPTFGRWVGFELTESNHLQLHARRGFAHGFQTLTDDCLVAYHISQFHQPEASAGIRWNDPGVAICWPRPVLEMSERDSALPHLTDVAPSLLPRFDESPV